MGVACVDAPNPHHPALGLPSPWVVPGAGATGTLMSLLGATGQGTPILTRPVEVVGRAPTDLASQGVGATLGYYAPSWMHLDHQRGLVCWWGERGMGEPIQAGGPPACSSISESLPFQRRSYPMPSPVLWTSCLSNSPGSLTCPLPWPVASIPLTLG